jgi:hypothetical protein
MTDHLLHETRLLLTHLAREQDVSIPTCWRWTQRGVRGHILDSFLCGGRKFTTREAFARWLSAINEEPVARNTTPRQRQRQIDQAERRAKELGL